MSFSFCSWCSWTKWARWVYLKFYLSLSRFNQVECGREMSPRFPCATPGVWELLLRPNANKVAQFSVCIVFVDDEANGGWFLFYWKLMLLWVMGVGLENTCIVSGKWHVSRVMPRLYGWVYKNWRLSPLGYKHSVVVMTTGSQSRRSQILSYG